MCCMRIIPVLGIVISKGQISSGKTYWPGEMKPVDVDAQGNHGTGDSQQGIDISADGRFVLFTLDAYGDVNLDPNAPADQGNQTGPLFRKDMDTGAVVRVDVLSDGSCDADVGCWLGQDVG